MNTETPASIEEIGIPHSPFIPPQAGKDHGSAVLGVVWKAAQVFGARIVAQAATFLAGVLVARVLGPAEFGLYSLALVGTLLLAQIPGAGVDLSAVRISTRYAQTDPQRAQAVLLAAGLLKTVIGVVFVAGALVWAEPIARTLGLAESGGLALRIAAVGALGQALTEFTLAALQAHERFTRIVWVSLVVAVIRFIPVVLLVLLGWLTLSTALVTFVAAAYAGLLVGVLASWRLWFAPRWPAGSVFRELASFGGWFTLATLVGTLASNLDLLAVSALLGAEAAGIYAAARNLTLPLAFAGSALMAVLLPRLSVLGEHAQSTAIRVTVAAGALTVAGVSALVLLAPLLFEFVYGAGYSSAVGVFQLLLIAYGLQLVTWPALALVMVRDRPDVVAGLIILVLVVSGIGYAVAVPALGLTGAALVFLGGYALQCAAYAPLLWRTQWKAEPS